MKSPQRRAGWTLLLALFVMPVFAAAQDNETAKIAGSGMAIPLVEALATASGADLILASEITGTTAGFQQFCGSQADMVAASRPLSPAENAACAEAGVEFIELLLAHNVLALIANPQDVYLQCLTTDELNAIFAPSSQSTILNWNQVNPAYADAPLTPLLPAVGSAASALLDRIVEGAGFRSDATTATSDEALIATVAQTPGALGAVTVQSARAPGDGVSILQINQVEAAGCVAPSAETVETRLYAAADSFLLYVNRAAVNQPGIAGLLNYITSPEAAVTVESQGFVPVTSAAAALNLAAIQGEVGPRFSANTSDFTIPNDVSGQVNLAGTADARDYLTALTSRFSQSYPGVIFDTRLVGTPAGIRRLCNGEADMVVTNSELTDEQRQNCEATNTEVVTLDLGQRAVVLVANAGSDYLSCLTLDHIAAIWQARSGEQVLNWNQVDPGFPVTPLTLFAPSNGSPDLDLLLRKAAPGSINRIDANINGDPLYRAAAAANVEGGLTVMSWQDYQQVLARNQANIQLVSIDSGAGCLPPDPTTIGSGAYGLAESFKLLINQSALAKPQAHSFAWYLLQDDNFDLFGENGFIGVEFAELASLRQTIQQAALEAQAAAAATPEGPAVEATPEATPAPGS